jgi:hypothetical protein
MTGTWSFSIFVDEHVRLYRAVLRKGFAFPAVR